MKKFLNISSLLLVALTMGFASCSHEEKDLFDDSAAQRLANSKEYFSDILTDQGGKWQLEYFTTTEEPGYIYLFTFQKNGTVTISGENKYIGLLTSNSNTKPVYGSGDSMWDIITDDGPVLTFNTYNKYFHLFADPEDIIDTEANEQGYGHEGDYEFDLMKYSNDTLYLEGKKHGVHMIMTRLASDVDDHQYLDEVVALKDSLFHAKIPTVFLNMPSGYRYVVSGGASLMLSLYPEDGDWVSETESYNAVVTHDGLTFMYPLQVTDSLSADKTTYEVKTFKLAPDGSLVCRENPEISFTADALNNLLNNEEVYWKINTNKSSPAGFMEAYNDLVAQLKAANKNNSITQLLLTYEKKTGKFGLSVTAKLRVKNQTINPICLFYFDVEKEGKDMVTLKFNGDVNDFAERYGGTYNKFYDMVNYLASTKFKLTSASLLAPVVIIMEEASNANNFLYLDVYRQ